MKYDGKNTPSTRERENSQQSQSSSQADQTQFTEIKPTMRMSPLVKQSGNLAGIVPGLPNSDTKVPRLNAMTLFAFRVVIKFVYLTFHIG